jgi:hypothetical protein
VSDLIDAVQAKLTGTGTITTQFGSAPARMFLDEALSTYGADTANYPYLEHGIYPTARGGSNLEHTFGRKWTGSVLYFFRAYGLLPEAARDALKSVTDVFDSSSLSLSMSNGTFLDALPMIEPYYENMQKKVGTAGKVVYRATAAYRIAFQH